MHVLSLHSEGTEEDTSANEEGRTSHDGTDEETH